MDQIAIGSVLQKSTGTRTVWRPVPASVLLDQELERKDKLRQQGNLSTGCRELDEYVLLGGFERGTIVGVSVEEEEEIGLLVSGQVLLPINFLTTPSELWKSQRYFC
jgi:hypothetical protein